MIDKQKIRKSLRELRDEVEEMLIIEFTCFSDSNELKDTAEIMISEALRFISQDDI